MTAALNFRNVTLGYDRHPAVHHLTGTVAAGALLAIIGPNGAGKSTLLKGIVGAIPTLDGVIERAQARREDIAYLPQIAEIDRSFPITIYDLVAMGLWRRAGLFGAIARGERDDIEKAISAVGLEGFESRTIGTLSGGQMQRALFARLLLQNAQLILLDEPFTSLDAKTISDLIDLIRRWHGERRTILIVLHDLDLARAQFPETLLLAREVVAWGKTPEVLTAENLLKARQMCEAFDRHAEVCETDLA
ncbi:MAG TPA: zinc ABC transporter ATP-binding protein AztA [Xanthobacteraceae bacterium]|nr:zinc ABC transporter ATP-binding protein AztA [Xanthobacteraceae bacterium]